CIYNDHDVQYKADPWVILPSNETFKCDIIESQCSNGNMFSSNESYLHMQIYEAGSLPQSLAYLKAEHGAVQMEFLNKLGINSRPNAFALFFGKTEEAGSRTLVGRPPIKADWDRRKKCREYIDKLPYELEQYRLRGYKIEKVPLGKYEQNNPFLMVSIPKRYRNTAIHEQLKKKSEELMTHYDLHATFMDILKLQPDRNFSDTSYRNMQPLSKGSSLLREWRGPRNCRTLPIPSEYCLCQYNRTTIIDDGIHEEAGRFLAEQLNMLLENAGLGGKCRKQSYHSTHSATETKDGNVSLYEIAVYLWPSSGLF
ncbi:hypothetical protein GCK32_015218, partial [Trichostrongylus colubriformis]